MTTPNQSPQSEASKPSERVAETTALALRIARRLTPNGEEGTIDAALRVYAAALEIQAELSKEPGTEWQAECATRDTERIDWLNENSGYTGGGNGGYYSFFSPADVETGMIRQAIDAAMAITEPAAPTAQKESEQT